MKRQQPRTVDTESNRWSGSVQERLSFGVTIIINGCGVAVAKPERPLLMRMPEYPSVEAVIGSITFKAVLIAGNYPKPPLQCGVGVAERRSDANRECFGNLISH